MEIRQLKYFDRISMRGSYSRAAEDLGVSEPTLSEQIKLLEQELGAPLFDRRCRPIRLTAAGQAIRQRVQNILFELRELRSEVDALTGLQSDSMTIGTASGTASLMSLVVTEFADRYPHIDVALQEDSRENVLLLLTQGKLDAGILLADADTHLPSELNAQRLFPFEFVFVVPANHPLGQRSTILLEQIKNERLILPSGYADGVLLATLGKAGLNSLHVLWGNKVTMVLDLVANGAGLGLSPDFLVRPHRELHALKAAEFQLAYRYDLVWRRETENLKKMRTL
ncbi:MAG: LysR family transcriptional regulator, partial [Chloroflexota bacterium]|nr:LysR family transcriptional regulator [Chloroflexota bacterium]